MTIWEVELLGGTRRQEQNAPRAQDVAPYVATMAPDLKALVEPCDLKPLAYWLDLVHQEAEQAHGDA